MTERTPANKKSITRRAGPVIHRGTVRHRKDPPGPERRRSTHDMRRILRIPAQPDQSLYGGIGSGIDRNSSPIVKFQGGNITLRSVQDRVGSITRQHVGAGQRNSARRRNCRRSPAPHGRRCG